MRRPTAVELMDHPWMVMFREALEDYQEETNMATKSPDPSNSNFERASMARQATRMHGQETISSPTFSDVEFAPPEAPAHQE